MCHGWRRTRGSPLFSVCTHNKIDDFWRGEGRGAGGRPGAADPHIAVSLLGGAVSDFPGAHLWARREMDRGEKKGRGKKEEMSRCPSAGLGSCLGPEDHTQGSEWGCCSAPTHTQEITRGCCSLLAGSVLWLQGMSWSFITHRLFLVLAPGEWHRFTLSSALGRKRGQTQKISSDMNWEGCEGKYASSLFKISITAQPQHVQLTRGL